MTLELTRTVDPAAARPPARRALWIERIARRAVRDRLAHLTRGRVTVADSEGTATFGPESAELQAAVTVHDPAFWAAVAFRGTVGAGESYIDGQWSCDDLTRLVRILVRDRATMEGVESGLARLAALPLKSFHAMRRNTKRGSSPASSMRAIQYTAASGSEPRMLLMNAETTL